VCCRVRVEGAIENDAIEDDVGNWPSDSQRERHNVVYDRLHPDDFTAGTRTIERASGAIGRISGDRRRVGPAGPVRQMRAAPIVDGLSIGSRSDEQSIATAQAVESAVDG